MSEERPVRVRITGPPRRTAARPRSRIGEVHEQTPLGGVYLRSLLRAQLLLAAEVVAALVVGLGTLPLIFHVWRGLAEASVGGVGVAWLLLGVVVYPFLVLLGWIYVRRVEHNEQVFTDLVAGDEEP